MRSILLLALAAVMPLGAASAQTGGGLQLATDRALQPSDLQGIHASVQQGVVTLTGAVELYDSKLNAEVAVSRIPGVRAIEDQVQVSGPGVPDAILQARLKRLIAFNTAERTDELPVRSQAISVTVHNGVVKLGGENADPLFAAVAFSTAANTPGVKGIVNGFTVKQFSTANLAPVYSISSVP